MNFFSDIKIKRGFNQRVYDEYGPEGLIKYLLSVDEIPKNLDLTKLKKILKSGDVIGRIVEDLYAEKHGCLISESDNQNTIGYDAEFKDGTRKELKSTSTKTVKNMLQINNVHTKENECNFMVILDLYNYRMFEIPHNDFFNKFSFYYTYDKYGRKKTSKMVWDAEYSGTRAARNTMLIQKYEIK
jgi:hypothetical protein